MTEENDEQEFTFSKIINRSNTSTIKDNKEVKLPATTSNTTSKSASKNVSNNHLIKQNTINAPSENKPQKKNIWDEEEEDDDFR